jgi:methyl-accepting chemotaxis protein
LENTRAVDTLIGGIAEASAEQASRIQHAVACMEQVDRLTQANAASAEETATSARALEDEANALRRELNAILDGRTAIETAESPASAAAEPVAA